MSRDNTGSRGTWSEDENTEGGGGRCPKNSRPLVSHPKLFGPNPAEQGS